MLGRAGGRQGQTEILCLIGSRNKCVYTHPNTQEDTNIKSSPESGWEVGKGIQCDLANGLVGLKKSFQKFRGGKQEERVTVWVMTVENGHKGEAE